MRKESAHKKCRTGRHYLTRSVILRFIYTLCVESEKSHIDYSVKIDLPNAPLNRPETTLAGRSENQTPAR